MSKLFIDELRDNYASATDKMTAWLCSSSETEEIIDKAFEDKIKGELKDALISMTKGGIKKFGVEIDDFLKIHLEHRESYADIIKLIRAGICQCSQKFIFAPEKITKLISVYPDKLDEAKEYLKKKVREYFKSIGLTEVSGSEMVYEI